MMFEKFGVPAFALGHQAVLSLFAAGKTTGLVVDCGHSVTNIVPVKDGRFVPDIMVNM